MNKLTRTVSGRVPYVQPDCKLITLQPGAVILSGSGYGEDGYAGDRGIWDEDGDY